MEVSARCRGGRRGGRAEDAPGRPRADGETNRAGSPSTPIGPDWESVRAVLIEGRAVAASPDGGGVPAGGPAGRDGERMPDPGRPSGGLAGRTRDEPRGPGPSRRPDAAARSDPGRGDSGRRTDEPGRATSDRGSGGGRRVTTVGLSTRHAIPLARGSDGCYLQSRGRDASARRPGPHEMPRRAPCRHRSRG